MKARAACWMSSQYSIHVHTFQTPLEVSTFSAGASGNL